MLSCCVYCVPERSRVYVIPIYHGCTSEHIIESAVDVTGFKNVLEEAFLIASRLTRWAGENPIMKELGARSFTSVVRQTHCITVYDAGDYYRWLRFRRSAKFRSFTPDNFEESEIVQTIDELATNVLGFFAGCE